MVPKKLKRRAPNFKDLTGKRFGRLVVTKEAKRKNKWVCRWLCKCDCGNETIIEGTSLKTGTTRSCGCLRNNKKILQNRKVDRTKYNLTQKDLKNQLRYNSRSGVWRWRYKKGNHKKWAVAGAYHKASKYHIIRINGFLYKAHVLSWVYMKGYFPENEVDHKDRDRQNNKWNNLREVSQICNARNCSLNSSNTSGVTGVSWCKDRSNWEVYITVNKRKRNKGRFEDFNDAVKARWEAEVEYGWPNCNTSSAAYLYLKDKGLIHERKEI